MLNRDYTVRRSPDGWGVYVMHTGEPVCLNGRAQTGLSRQAAIELLASLRTFAFIEGEFGNRPGIKGVLIS
ncbi:hypothetical protein [Methylobacterium oryzisoli]|uniref:hypothetical protein n=1 Tax=Methylobacterium oryzisoli TaxID=3385502 RepID=UPI0038926384